MPTYVSEAIEFMVLVCEESYRHSITDDEEFHANSHQILLDAMNRDVDDIWYEHWVVRKGQTANDHPASSAHELMGREWREM